MRESRFLQFWAANFERFSSPTRVARAARNSPRAREAIASSLERFEAARKAGESCARSGEHANCVNRSFFSFGPISSDFRARRALPALREAAPVPEKQLRRVWSALKLRARPGKAARARESTRKAWKRVGEG